MTVVRAYLSETDMHTHTSDYLRYINARKLNSLKHCVISQITRLRLDACIHAECGHFEQLL